MCLHIYTDFITCSHKLRRSLQTYTVLFYLPFSPLANYSTENVTVWDIVKRSLSKQRLIAEGLVAANKTSSVIKKQNKKNRKTFCAK